MNTNNPNQNQPDVPQQRRKDRNLKLHPLMIPSPLPSPFIHYTSQLLPGRKNKRKTVYMCDYENVVGCGTRCTVEDLLACVD